ncbi:hypothetical protein Q7C30_001415 [Pseudomonas sp. RAC1]|uniref:hypothetical protein n=1 Tax=Pseudomonas sp. RAC1 TaxID=3064900 RepID=UPI00271A5BB1|nr:hypothetical protein [Pseudomonas sp. RAC1]MDV9030762.1 hypothetical protein [Pseudomonas sp. RAC1]
MKQSDSQKSHGEQERDNDARRPDGSSGTSHDSTAQKAAREKDKRPKKGAD